jgi:cytochrome oxidase Cu insertion factor (SCO1/SenC/PrrC family)
VSPRRPGVRVLTRALCCAAGLGLAAPGAARAAGAEAPSPAAARVVLEDAPLVDQDGLPVQFRRDAIGDDVVVVDFVFTTCTTVCPALSAIFARVQEQLGDRLGRGVRLVSVSLDPAHDTPPRLKAYAARHHAGRHWTWLTGPQPDVERVLKGLGAYTANFSAHSPMVLVGDGRTGEFTRINGFPAPGKVAAEVDRLLARRAAAGASAQGALP